MSDFRDIYWSSRPSDFMMCKLWKGRTLFKYIFADALEVGSANLTGVFGELALVRTIFSDVLVHEQGTAPPAESMLCSAGSNQLSNF